MRGEFAIGEVAPCALRLTLVFAASMWAVVFMTPVPAAADSPPAVIACDTCSTDPLNKRTVRKMFLGKKQQWDDGKRVVVTAQRRGEAQREFLRLVLGMSRMQFRIYWLKRVFTGQGLMPKWFDGEAEQAAYVEKRRGGIGYAGDPEILEKSKPIMVID